MKSSKNKTSIVLFFKGVALTLSFFCLLSLTPSRPLFTITGICKQNGKPIEGVDVSILIDGGVLTHNITDANGRYRLSLNFGKLVKLGFEKKGYLLQTVKLRTVLNGIPETEMTYQYNFEMLALPSDTSNITFEKPVDEIIFDNNSNIFVSNSDYKDGVKADFDAVKKMIEEQKK